MRLGPRNYFDAFSMHSIPTMITNYAYVMIPSIKKKYYSEYLTRDSFTQLLHYTKTMHGKSVASKKPAKRNGKIINFILKV